MSQFELEFSELEDSIREKFNLLNSWSEKSCFESIPFESRSDALESRTKATTELIRSSKCEIKLGATLLTSGANCLLV